VTDDKKPDAMVVKKGDYQASITPQKTADNGIKIIIITNQP